ncbi:MurR/RpiR family transcriptional regulator [Paracoccus angustae]|uniref:MurR/RpiR family transcriptional regulator n=1 Tax=Paracoccus angustae TaxID=1671480 RepID=A0ABV7U7S7_9RHOB
MTIEQRMRASLPALTRAERQAATHILSHFPMSALGSITMLASAAEVSAPTIVRLVQKLGFKGYAEYQAALRIEVGRLLAAPLALPDQEPRRHPMQSFAARAIANIHATLDQIATREFDAAAALLADPARHVAVMGGRLTHAHADYMATLLRVIRPGVTYISDHLTDWQQALLDLRAEDVVVIFDIRRYESNAVHMAELAAGQGARVVLVTDHRLSPAAGHAHHTLPCRIDMPAAWDSTVAVLLLVEALLSRVQGHCADQVQDRLNRLEDIFARTRLFRAPRLPR